MRNKVSLTNKIRMLAVVASIFFCAGQIALLIQSTPSIADLDNGIKPLNGRKFNEAIEVLKTFSETNKTDARVDRQQLAITLS